MKRTIVLILFLFAGLMAQKPSPYHWGIVMGFDFSTISGERCGCWKEVHSRPGLRGGVFMEDRQSDLKTLHIGLLYNETGSKWGQPLFGLGYDGDYAIYSLTYISIPAYYKIKSHIGTLKFDFIIGPMYSYNLSAKQEWVVEVDGPWDIGPDNIRKEIKRHEFGILYGAALPIKAGKINLNFLFYKAITKLYSTPIKTYANDFQDKYYFRNNTFSLGMEYIF